ncbi:MCE family protein [[Mycobacterium] burgundiense]|uniref:MCE family protein n=1 Tax=[Mycobacterium] burgundiense TaxID=3064286 RepID=A0ABM9LHU7_9MYCO|nr:MCE family protein [Mycolicibacterium sp. MU0053]CAJ1499250.1 MCE family protein [Mycolicibacterium sp. MU0053]
MIGANLRHRATVLVGAVTVLSLVTGCGSWRGLNSVPMPGTAGDGAGSYTIQAQLPDVSTVQENSRVRVGDVNVGTVTKIELQNVHALLTMRLDGDVDLPANTTVKVGQTSLLGSTHIELAAPADAQGRLRDGDLLPLASGGAYPNTEQTLSALSLLLNGGGVGKLQDITTALSTAFTGRENDLRDLITEIDTFMARINSQTDDIIAATESLNGLAAQVAAQKPVVDRALATVPDALTVLSGQRDNLAEAADKLGQFSAVANQAVSQSKEALVAELEDLGPALEALANAGPDLTRGLSLLTTFPWAKETVDKWFRGDYANLTAVIDLTLSRIDTGFFTGTRFEGDLTKLELQWGRTIGQTPSPYTAGNPLVVPYQANQGP